MAAYESSRAAPVGAISLLRVAHFVSETFSSLSAWNDARVTRGALGNLSDRELDDIGLSRGDIEFIAARA